MNYSILEISKETGKHHVESMNAVNNSKGKISILLLQIKFSYNYWNKFNEIHQQKIKEVQQDILKQEHEISNPFDEVKMIQK
jgi:hypothetical protein